MGYDNGRRASGGDRRDKRQGGYGSDDGARESFGGRGRGEDRSESQYGAPASAPARSARSSGPAETITGTLKFYNGDKGFGFVSVPGKGDAFLHVSAFDIEPASLPEGTTVVCTVGEDPRQPGKTKVFEVMSYDVTTATSSPQRGPARPAARGPRSDGPTTTGVGTVQWFNSTKGYGFLQMEDGVSVFVHASALERSNIASINEGDRLSVDYISEERGFSARQLRTI
jgi:CspA family cold shock protein